MRRQVLLLNRATNRMFLVLTVVTICLLQATEGAYIVITLPLPLSETAVLDGTNSFKVTPALGDSDDLDQSYDDSGTPTHTYLCCQDGPSTPAGSLTNDNRFRFEANGVVGDDYFLLRKFSVRTTRLSATVDSGFVLQYADFTQTTTTLTAATAADALHEFDINPTNPISPTYMGRDLTFGVFTGSNDNAKTCFREFKFYFDPVCVPSDAHGTFNPAVVPSAANTATLTCANGYYVLGSATVTCTGVAGGGGTSALSAVGTCTACPQTNCKTCAGGVCSACDPGYRLDAGNCAGCSINCDVCSPSACTTCAAGFLLASGACAAACITNCNRCTTATTCTECKLTFGLNAATTACNPCAAVGGAGCNVCSITACNACMTGFILSGLTCAACTTLHCATCSSTTVCTACVSGYYLSGATCIECLPAACVADSQWMATSRCGITSPTTSGCTDCSSSNCAVGTYFSSTTCATAIDVSGCLACSSSNCNFPSESYTASLCLGSASGCRACSVTISNCDVCNTAGTTCSSCTNAHYAPSASALMCTSCAGQTGCAGNAYRPTGATCGGTASGCEACAGAEDGAQCTACNAATCTSCSTSTYVVDGTVCVACSDVVARGPGCAQCTTTACTTCTSSSYYLASGACTVCAVSTTPSGPTGVANCVTCSYSGGASVTCLTCAATFWLNGAACAACGTCANPGQYKPVATACTSASSGCAPCSNAIAHCTTCAVDGSSCSACSTGYYPDGASCLPCSDAMTECSECSSASVCTKCGPGGTNGYFVKNDACSACSNSECTTPGQYMEPTLCGGSTPTSPGCTTCPSQCTACTTSSTCSGCSDGFYLAGSSCLNCNAIAGCTRCNAGPVCTRCTPTVSYVSLGTCLLCGTQSVCTDGQYYVVGGSTCGIVGNPQANGCAACPQANCKTCATGTPCTVCLANFYLNAGACQPCQSSNCLVDQYFDNNKCGKGADPTAKGCIPGCLVSQVNAAVVDAQLNVVTCAAGGATSVAPGGTCTVTCKAGFSSANTGGDAHWACAAAGSTWTPPANPLLPDCRGMSCHMRDEVGNGNRPENVNYMVFGHCLDDVNHLSNCTLGCALGYYLRNGSTDNFNQTQQFECIAAKFNPTPDDYHCLKCPNKCATCASGTRCLTCAYGYQYNASDSLGCIDMNLCAINNGGCGLDAVCDDGDGERTCDCGSSGCAVACDVVNHGSSVYFQPTFVSGIPIQGFGDIPQVPLPCSLDSCYAYNVHTAAPSAVADVNRFSIDVWVMFAPVGLDYTTSVANGGPLVGAQPDVGTNNNYFVLSVTAAGFVQYDFRLGGSASSVLCDDRATLFDGKWHHVLLSHYVDTGASLPTRITIRVDGTSSPKGSTDRSAGTFFSWPATSGGLYLGSHKPIGSSWQLFRGHMSHLRIWLGAIPRTTAVDAYVSKLSYDLCNRYLSEYTNVGDASQPFYLLLSLPMYDFSVLDGSADRTRLSLAPSPGYYVFGPANSNPSAVQLTTLPLGVTYRRIESAGTDVCKSAALACAARGMRVCTKDEYLGISSPPALIVGGGTGTRSTWRHTLHQSSPASTGTDDDYCQGTELGRGYRCCMPYLINSEWGNWTACNQTCGGGFRNRACSPGTRGLACEGSSQMACNTVPCQADRQVPRVSDPDIPCSQDCGSHGIQAQTCNRVQLDDWINCVSDAFVNCSRTPCIPAEYFYGEYSECSANCTRSDPPAGYHAPHRTRICYMIQDDGVHGPVKTALADAAECRQRSYGDDTVLCNRHFCPIHGGWSDWSNCSATCNGGNRTRTCTAPPPAYSGRYCEGQSREACGLGSCVVLGIWSEWSNCSVNCGPGGTRFRFCSAVYPEPPAACVGPSVEPCSAPDCTVQGEWGPWKPCNQTCGSGGRRFRECNNPVPVPFPTTATDPLWCKGWPAGRMGACENGTETACREPGGWSSWSNCTKPCGGGFRNRNCTNPKPKMGHPTCIGHVEEPCNLRPCPVSGSWSDWSDCNVPCGNGTRIRFCNNPPTQFGGAFCPGSNSTACSKPDCSVPLGFGPWGPCSKECGGGIQTRGCLPPGAGCPEKGLTVQACNNESCSSFGEWSKWTACSRDCGGGVQTRNCTSTNRTCLGVTSQRCNEFSCDADGEWTPWSDCSVDFCGGGVQTRKCLGRLGLGRLCNLTDGTPDKDIETKSCFDDPCPADICTIPGVCQNNATCIDVQNYGPGWRFLCDCTPFTFGKHCEFRIVPCDTHPCDNGGTCTNVNGTVNGTVVGVAYNCTCPPGYEGSSCHTVARQTRIPGPVGESTPPPPTKEEQIAAKAETVEERVARLEREGLNVKWYTGALDEGLGETDKHNLNRIVVAWREGQEDGQQRLVPHAKDTAEAISRQAKLLNPDLTPQLPYDSSLPNPSNQPG